MVTAALPVTRERNIEMATSAGSEPYREVKKTMSVGSRQNWDEIERSESYLVCCMFDEAASLASCVLKRICDDICTKRVVEDIELYDMLESAGMVFVQSLKELGRTLEIINELMQLYGSLTAIPVEVFITGVCFQMQEDPSGVKKFLEEFLSKWSYVDEQYYALVSVEKQTGYTEGHGSRFVLAVDTYLKVVEVYVTLLAGILSDMDLAISWVKKAALPEQKRQLLLRRVHSIYSSKVTSSQACSTTSPADEGRTSSSLKKQTSFERSKTLEAGKVSNADSAVKQAILRYSGQRVPTVWWFRTINLKVGNLRLAVSNGNMFLATLILLAYYFLRRKKYTITEILKGQTLFVKKAVIDLWQLAFSYQVNPLAAVEPLHNATRGSR